MSNRINWNKNPNNNQRTDLEPIIIWDDETGLLNEKYSLDNES